MKIKNISKDKKDTKVKKKGQNKPRCGGLSALSCSSLKKNSPWAWAWDRPTCLGYFFKKI